MATAEKAAISHVDACIEAQLESAKSWNKEEYSTVRDALVVNDKFYADDGRYQEAETVCGHILDHDKKYPAQMAIALLKNLAHIFRQGRHDEAVSLYRDALVCQESYVSKEHLDIMDTQHPIAQVVPQPGQTRRGHRHIRERAPPTMPPPSTTIPALSMLTIPRATALSTRLLRAIDLLDLSRVDEDVAKDAFRDIIERFGRVFSPYYPNTLRAVTNFSILYDRSDRVDVTERVEELWLDALAGREIRQWEFRAFE
ncbi:hypothetical protein F4777DRAFT_582381 [Nemania sp. FL0916]|nr:hypothetical protein F4777DRAFT_582381 [Nemania sp. FL0916]